MDRIAYSAAFDSIEDFKIFGQNYALMSSLSSLMASVKRIIFSGLL